MKSVAFEWSFCDFAPFRESQLISVSLIVNGLVFAEQVNLCNSSNWLTFSVGASLFDVLWPVFRWIIWIFEIFSLFKILAGGYTDKLKFIELGDLRKYALQAGGRWFGSASAHHIFQWVTRFCVKIDRHLDSFLPEVYSDDTITMTPRPGSDS